MKFLFQRYTCERYLFNRGDRLVIMKPHSDLECQVLSFKSATSLLQRKERRIHLLWQQDETMQDNVIYAG